MEFELNMKKAAPKLGRLLAFSTTDKPASAYKPPEDSWPSKDKIKAMLTEAAKNTALLNSPSSHQGRE